MGKSPHLGTCINVTSTEILEHKPLPPRCTNITRTDLETLEKLRNNKNLVIKKADKGGAIVLMNKQDYIKEGLQQLCDPHFYKEIQRDPTNKNTTEIIKKADKGGAIVLMNKQDYIKEGLRQLCDPHFYKEIQRDPTNKNTTEIQKFLSLIKEKKLLSQEHITFISSKNCRTPLFYLFQKIHKANNPGRPIVSACDSPPRKKISLYLDLYLKPPTLKVTSYIRDTTDFLQKLKELGQIHKDSLLVTIDVVSLYTNIPNKDGTRATKYALETRQSKEPKTWVLLRLLHFILIKTAFKFNDKFYELISGTTMGTKCAPSYSILFMDKFEISCLPAD